jgi:hypothetical protein
MKILSTLSGNETTIDERLCSDEFSSREFSHFPGLNWDLIKSSCRENSILSPWIDDENVINNEKIEKSPQTDPHPPHSIFTCQTVFNEG